MTTTKEIRKAQEEDAHLMRLYNSLDAMGFFSSSRTPEEIEEEIQRCLTSTLTSIPLLRSGYEIPTHLTQLCDIYDQVERAGRGECEPILCTISAPSQVGKTSAGEVAMARLLARNPTFNIATLAYGESLARERSKNIRDDVLLLGGHIREDSGAVQHWRLEEGGSFFAAGLEGPITGRPGLTLIEIDDPYKDESEVYSAAHKRWLRAVIKKVILTRRNPRTSVIIKHTRWATDDLIGWIEKEAGNEWKHYTIPAVDEKTGEPLVTIGGRDKAWWAATRKSLGEETWWSIMMGKPRPRDGKLFKGVVYGDCPSNSGVRISIGIDLAYSSKKTSDYSVAVVIKQYNGIYYVSHVVRRQCESTDFATELHVLKKLYPGVPMRGYLSGIESGTISFFKKEGLPIEVLPASQDKYSRAIPASAGWTKGLVQVPAAASWAQAFVDELKDFPTADHDDQVDAFAAAYDGLPSPKTDTTPIIQPPSPYRSQVNMPWEQQRQATNWIPGMGRPKGIWDR